MPKKITITPKKANKAVSKINKGFEDLKKANRLIHKVGADLISIADENGLSDTCKEKQTARSLLNMADRINKYIDKLSEISTRYVSASFEE